MVSQEIIRAFKESACGEIDLSSSGLNRYLVDVPFTFTDGDHFVVILRQEDQKWVLSDEGHTFMHLSYDLRDKEYEKGNRRKKIDEVLAQYQIEDKNGELILTIPEGRYGDALFTFVQAITRITDISFLERELVKDTFREDFNALVANKSKEVGIRNVNFGYTHPTFDPQRKYPIDARLNGSPSQQIFVFGIGNNDQCQTATIILYQWEKWQERFQSIAIFRDQTEINKTYLARFSDVAGRQLSSLDSAKERLPRYFTELLTR